MAIRFRFFTLALGAAALHGCAIRSAGMSPSGQLLADASVPSPAGFGVMVPGLRLDDVAVPSDLRATLVSLEASCPAFADHLLWVECTEEPCLVHLWGHYANRGSETTWQAATCGLGAPDITYQGGAAHGAPPYVLWRTVFAWNAPAGFVLSQARAHSAVLPLHDAIEALASETYGPPSDPERQEQAEARAGTAAVLASLDEPDPE